MEKNLFFHSPNKDEKKKKQKKVEENEKHLELFSLPRTSRTNDEMI
jgi:hypothetical protein